MKMLKNISELKLVNSLSNNAMFGVPKSFNSISEFTRFINLHDNIEFIGFHMTGFNGHIYPVIHISRRAVESGGYSTHEYQIFIKDEKEYYDLIGKISFGNPIKESKLVKDMKCLLRIDKRNYMIDKLLDI